MTELLKLAPATAVLLTLDAGGRVTAEEEVPVALVQRGDHLKVCRLVRILRAFGTQKLNCFCLGSVRAALSVGPLGLGSFPAPAGCGCIHANA